MRNPFNKSKGQIPDFIIIGVGRAGTTTVYDFLCSHPDVQPASQKEVGWFYQSEKWYKSQFPEKLLDKITGEATPYYFLDIDSPKKFKKLNPELKVILLRRDPFDRAYSHWCMNVSGGFESLSFEDALKMEKQRIKNSKADYFQFSYINSGNYKKHLKHWEEYFSDILILEFDELQQTPESIQRKLCEYLNLIYVNNEFKKVSIVPKPDMDHTTEQRLRELFNELMVVN